IPILGGELLLFLAFWRLGRGLSWRAFAVTGAAICTGGFVVLSHISPSWVPRLLREDVLQAIGAAIVAIATLTHGSIGRRRSVLVASGVAVGCLTAWMRAWVPGPLPDPVAAYIAAWPPPSGAVGGPAGLFPLFPWLAYALIGAALGLGWRPPSRRQILQLSVFGAVLAFATSESWAHVHEFLSANPWSVQPLRVAYRLGVAFTLVGMVYPTARHLSIFATFGRVSLLIYWVHLEFAFGLASKPFKGRLDLLSWFVGCAVLCVGMFTLARFRLRQRKRLANQSAT
ncbi:MAG: hypothetical protein KC416_02030, partial [Myxococcales bacterium]|nr:hypothetical protein [Myxococcales bacterium]